MAVGSYAYYNATATVDIDALTANTFTDFDPTWTEVADADGIASIASGNINIDEAGRYLVMYYIKVNKDTSTTRIMVQGRARKNTTVIEGSYGAGFARDDNNREAYVRGSFIANFALDEDIDIQIQRDATTGGTGTISETTETEIVIVRLPDSADAAYAIYSDAADTGLHEGDGIYDDFPWDTIEEETDTAVIQRQSGNVNIRLKKIARYLVIYSVSFDSGASVRSQRVARAQLAGSTINASHTYCYKRQADENLQTINAVFIVDNGSVNQDLKIQGAMGDTAAECDSGGGQTRQINASGLFIVELPSSTEVCGFADSTGGQHIAPATITDLNLARTEGFRDAASFTSPSITEIQVEKTDNYLFMANVHSIRQTLTDAVRATAECRWRVNNTAQTRGRHGNYARGDQGTQDTFGWSCNPQTVLELTALDDVELAVIADGDAGGGDDDTQVNQAGIFALNLGTLAGGLGDQDFIIPDVWAGSEAVVTNKDFVPAVRD